MDERSQKMTLRLILLAQGVVDSYIPFFIHNSIVLVAILVVNILYLFAYAFYFNKYYNVARILLVLGPQVATTAVGYLSYQGPLIDTAAKLTIFATLIIPLVTIDIRERKLLAAGIMIVTTSFLLSDKIGKKVMWPILKPTGDIDTSVYYFTVFADMFALVISFILLQRLNLKHEEQISSLLRRERQLHQKIIQQTKKVQRHHVSLLKLKMLAAQMNPHFTFNALASIQYYIMKAEQKSAYIFLSKFAHLIRSILENARRDRILLSQELENLQLYIELQAIRFSNCFEFTLKVPENISLKEILIPSALIQPYVENAIEHGLSLCETRGELRLEFELVDNHIKCIIEDNGIGREQAKLTYTSKKKIYKSYGMKIARERLRLLNNSRKNIEFKIVDLYNDGALPRGTRVEITFPFYRS